MKDCIACTGVQVEYGKYASEDGATIDNSYFLFKDPAHKKGDEALPIIIHFHGGGFFMGEPWKQENKEIRDYLRKGFAVVSVGYRLVSQKYFYKSDGGEQKVEELIHIAPDGGLELNVVGRTMDDYKVRVGKQEFITKVLFDAAAMIEHLAEEAESLGLDPHRIVFVGESSGGAAIQYLTWVYHKLNKDLFTPRGMILTDAQLDYPVDNMLGQTWDLFVETMGAQVKLGDVVSQEACPIVVGNHMCDSKLGQATDYDLCNEAWNKKSMEAFCGESLHSATLGEVRKSQLWKQDSEKADDKEKPQLEDDKEVSADPPQMQEMETSSHDEKLAFLQKPTEDKEIEANSSSAEVKKKQKGNGDVNASSEDDMDRMEILWYTSQNMQKHLPSEPFYMYIANSRNGTSHTDVAHHSIYALNFAKYAEMGKQGGLEYTVYYTDFARMTKADRGMQRVQVSRMEVDDNLTYPIGAVPASTEFAAPGAPIPAIPASLSSPLPAPAPAPAAGNTFITEVYNYLSTHDWRESIVGNDVQAVSLDERVLYACLAVGMGPFHGVVRAEENTTTQEPQSLKDAAVGSSYVSFLLSLFLPVAFLVGS
jgi:hypothetical protein